MNRLAIPLSLCGLRTPIKRYAERSTTSTTQFAIAVDSAHTKEQAQEQKQTQAQKQTLKH